MCVLFFMKLFDAKAKLKNKMINMIYLAYKWGYSDKESNLSLKSFEEVEKSFNKGFNSKQ